MDSIERIIRDLSQGHFRITLHARKRMAERNISDSDLIECGRTVQKTFELQNSKFEIRGLDLDGEPLTIIAVWDGETLVITTF